MRSKFSKASQSSNSQTDDVFPILIGVKSIPNQTSVCVAQTQGTITGIDIIDAPVINVNLSQLVKIWLSNTS